MRFTSRHYKAPRHVPTQPLRSAYKPRCLLPPFRLRSQAPSHRMDPVTIVELIGMGLKIGQQLLELKTRILAKPADKKTLCHQNNSAFEDE